MFTVTLKLTPTGQREVQTLPRARGGVGWGYVTRVETTDQS